MESSSILNETIAASDEHLPIWVAYAGSPTFQVHIRPPGLKQAEFVVAAIESKRDRATMQKGQVLNTEKYLQLFVDWVIVDWKGLTVKDLRRLIPLKDWKRIRHHKGEIGCDTKAKLLLMQFSPVFSRWINLVCFFIERDEKAKNRDSKLTLNKK